MRETSRESNQTAKAEGISCPACGRSASNKECHPVCIECPDCGHLIDLRNHRLTGA
jgi:ssDNA-binding Zn-finger/Zn-ribbon topoisomerase 1